MIITAGVASRLFSGQEPRAKGAQKGRKGGGAPTPALAAARAGADQKAFDDQ